MANPPHLILVPGLMCDEAVWEHQAVHLRDIATITIADHGSLESLTAMADSILEMIARKTPDIFAAQIKALLSRPDATAVLSQIRCPALVLCGRQDFWSVLARHEQMAAMIPNSRLVVIENCGHMSTMERPAEVTAALREWLTSL